MDEDEFGKGSMFKSRTILIGMVAVALLAVVLGMGGQRTAQDKDAHVYAAQQKAQERADRVAGFDEAEPTK